MEKSKTIDELKNEACAKYLKEFEMQPSCAAVAPGRVNLIGEHTDYNEGFVLPMAIASCTVAVGGPSKDTTCRIWTLADSVDEPKLIEFAIPNVAEITPGLPKWANYIKGVVHFFGKISHGFNAVFASSVPLGGGLSSSASVEVATYMLLAAMFGDPEKQLATENETDVLIRRAKRCQLAEHRFAGMPCGLMDQAISFVARRNTCMLLDCGSFNVDLIPLQFPKSLTLLIVNSNVRHELSTSEYAVRRAQCNAVAQAFKVSSLRHVSLADLARIRDADLEHAAANSRSSESVSFAADAGTLRRRAVHVLTENERVQQVVATLKRTAATSGVGEAEWLQAFQYFGQQMYASHASLRDDYTVSCAELDELVALCRQVDGVLGARMTGGGFGGCIICLVCTDRVDALVHHIQSNYSRQASFYVSQSCDGARILPL